MKCMYDKQPASQPAFYSRENKVTEALFLGPLLLSFASILVSFAQLR